MIGVIFDGGGCRSAYSVGFAAPIWDAYGDLITYVQGVSGGALNAAKIIEADSTKSLEVIWKYVEKQGEGFIFEKKTAARRIFLNILPDWLKKPLGVETHNAIFTGNGLKELVKFLDVEKTAQSPKKLDIIVTDETNNNKRVVFSNDNLGPENYQDFLLAIQASASLMGAFPPVFIKDHLYSDGLQFDIELALAQGCTTVFVLYNNHIWLSPPISPQVMSFEKRTRRISSLLWAQMVEVSLENLMRRYQDLLLVKHPYLPETLITAARNAGPRSVGPNRKLVFIGPTETISTLFILGFAKGDITRAIIHGKKVAAEIVQNYKSPA